MVLKCLIIFYAQILPGSENQDIQDLILNIFILFSAQEFKRIESEEELFVKEFLDEGFYGDSDDEDI